MNYELAIKLKEAGFPHVRVSSEKIWVNDDWQSPTLSELIEACNKDGKTFSSLNYPEKNIWRATGYHNKKDIYGDCYGPTPEEAVANLWLEINKK